MNTGKNPTPKRPNRNLYIPQDPLRYELRKIQMLIRSFEKSMYEGTLVNFNSKSFMDLLARHTEIINELKRQGNDKKRMAQDTTGKAAQVGSGTPASLDSGVPTDNPFAR